MAQSDTADSGAADSGAVAAPPAVDQDALAVLRPEIAQSWRRAQLAGLDPAAPFHRLTHRDVDRRSRLLRAATPVLDAIADNLAGTTFTVVLADRDAQIVDRRFGQAWLADTSTPSA